MTRTVDTKAADLEELRALAARVDRLVYEAGQIEAMVASDVEGACGCWSDSAGELRAAASSLA